MKTVLASRSVEIPAGVEVEINARVIKVTGPRGSLTRNFKHLSMDLRKVENSIRVDVWFANRKQLATVRTVISHIDNMFVGVTRIHL